MTCHAKDHIRSESSSGPGRSVFLGAALLGSDFWLSWTASSSLSSSLLSDSLSVESLSASFFSVGAALDPDEAIMSGLNGWNWTLPIASAISSFNVCRRTFCHSTLKELGWRLWRLTEHATDIPCRNIALLTTLAGSNRRFYGS
jgi:hypothetical protein